MSEVIVPGVQLELCMNAMKSESRLVENVHECPDWATITHQFDTLPKPVWRRDAQRETRRPGWIFRGHKRASYPLQPSIERVSACDWAEAEYRILREFQSKARMHMDPIQLPPVHHKLGWLAIIQHYGAPTRLLDFTYSPYVALYFALRNREKGESDYAEVWAFDAAALREQARNKGWEAGKETERQKGKSPKRRPPLSMNPADTLSALQLAQEEDEHWDVLIRRTLRPCGTRREHFNSSGFVAVALPPLQNPRLSSQQGVFLLNGAEALSFELSLQSMMQGVEQPWYKRFRVPEKSLDEMEEQLFQLNIHDLSLFPDVEGLAGFVRQKIRLHW